MPGISMYYIENRCIEEGHVVKLKEDSIWIKILLDSYKCWLYYLVTKDKLYNLFV